MSTTTATNTSAPFPPPSLLPLLTSISALLRATTSKVALVETACGGLLSSSLLSQPGASSIYAGGLTLYTLPSRLRFGGWTASDVAAYNGPTTDIVTGLARHARDELGATWALAESGTAGPGASGQGRNRQPGYVALAVVGPGGKVVVREVETGLGGDRTGNMVRFAAEGLKLLEEVLKGEGEEEGGRL